MPIAKTELSAKARSLLPSAFNPFIYKKLLLTVAGALALQSQAVIAVDREDVRAHVLPNAIVAVADSAQTDSIRDSLVKPWLNEYSESGSPLSGLQAESTQSVLRVPMRVDRFTQGKINIEGAENVTLYLNGVRVSGTGSEFTLNLETGDHHLVALVEGIEDWSAVNLDWQGTAEHDQVNSDWPSDWRLSAAQLYDAPTVNGVDLSADGRYLVMRKSWQQNGEAQSELLLRDLEENRVVYRWNNTSVASFAWHPQEHKLAYISDQKVQVLDVNDLSVKEASSALTGANGLRWLTDNTLIFSWNKTAESESSVTKRYQALEDRWSYFRNVSQLYTLALDTGVIAQITEGGSGHSLLDVHSSGERILVSTRKVDYAAPPHFAVEAFELNLVTNERRDLGTHRTFNQALYQGDTIYVTAGPEFMEGAGRAANLSDDMLSNNYDGQLYQLAADNSVRALSREFNPAIGGVMALGNGDLLLRVTDRDATQLYRYDTRNNRYIKVSAGVEVVDQVTASQHSFPRIVIGGTSATEPQKLVSLDLQEGRLRELWNSAEAYAHNDLNAVKEWNFTNKHGDEIAGRVYYPHNFDENKNYPALVYYYGGTTPVQRGFTGRYPFNLWANKGYVVYVLQPTGATGFGQEFSARHVNAWGEYTAEDIIQGTEEFLAAHSFVDADRVGHMGASYGGFMTMLLATMTDLYSASMSHAGISNITSYWGQGWWGFLYSGEASKGSFPWNNAELYTQQSPVFHADKVTAPMLLIHGDADTNVPPGESHNMYTALKLLDKEVELVEYKGQDHHIMGREARLNWWATYMAWFDKQLKGEPEWWNHLYPEAE
ncbi:dipeptidyl aminopeptidase/acylaminoacyl peptidase [Idiomarina sp. A28L]|uniref:alpha/beta hydrolase family protein n=1 Tax=Idiomarina sp. A28L TaxID=1036674 RepID=UPI0002138AE8|nr:prolyl oligopeptidase family serine peptidase [Idiomarina sp. A28L]EGN74300.1 dipeptidyl aminopeptidase/acylaminoacyl peptidase [Idiomarina sp. A28L]